MELLSKDKNGALVFAYCNARPNNPFQGIVSHLRCLHASELAR